MDVRDIPLDLIDHPATELRATVEQEYLEGLANSIKEVGLLHPIRVLARDGRYEIISGNCRYLAARIADLATIPCVVTTTAERNLPAMTLHENLMRRDVSHMDIARYLVHLKTTKGLSVDELAKTFRYSVTWVYQHLKLMDCDPEIRDAVDGEQLNYLAGLELMRIPDEGTRRVYLASAVRAGASYSVVKGWVASDLVQRGLRPASPPVSPGAQMSTIPELTFTCAACLGQFKSDQQIIVRVCSEDYQMVMAGMRLLREQLHAAKETAAAPPV